MGRPCNIIHDHFSMGGQSFIDNHLMYVRTSSVIGYWYFQPTKSNKDKIYMRSVLKQTNNAVSASQIVKFI